MVLMSFKWFQMPRCIPPTKNTKTKRNHEMAKNITIDKNETKFCYVPLLPLSWLNSVKGGLGFPCRKALLSSPTIFLSLGFESITWG